MNKMMGMVLLSLVLAGCQPAGESSGVEIEYLNSPAYEGMSLPFTEAVRVGDLLFLAGKIGNIPGSRDLVPGGIQGETRQILESFKATVERFGSSMDRVVKCTVFMADIAEWSQMNEVYVEFFPNNKPARSALGVSGLALDARVEIECVAAVGT